MNIYFSSFQKSRGGGDDPPPEKIRGGGGGGTRPPRPPPPGIAAYAFGDDPRKGFLVATYVAYIL